MKLHKLTTMLIRKNICAVTISLLLPLLSSLQLQAQVLVYDDFTTGTPGGVPDGWVRSPTTNPWKLSDPLGYLVFNASATASGLIVTQPGAEWTDYTTTVAFEFTLGEDRVVNGGDFGIVSRYVDSSNFYHLRIRENGRDFQIYKWVDGTPTLLKSSSIPAVDALVGNTTYYMRFTNVGASLVGAIALDPNFTNVLIEISVEDSAHTSGGVGLRDFITTSGRTADLRVDYFETVVVPEPYTVALIMGSGLLFGILLHRRMRNTRL